MRSGTTQWERIQILLRYITTNATNSGSQRNNNMCCLEQRDSCGHTSFFLACVTLRAFIERNPRVLILPDVFGEVRLNCIASRIHCDPATTTSTPASMYIGVGHLFYIATEAWKYKGRNCPAPFSTVEAYRDYYVLHAMQCQSSPSYCQSRQNNNNGILRMKATMTATLLLLPHHRSHRVHLRPPGLVHVGSVGNLPLHNGGGGYTHTRLRRARETARLVNVRGELPLQIVPAAQFPFPLATYPKALVEHRIRDGMDDDNGHQLEAAGLFPFQYAATQARSSSSCNASKVVVVVVVVVDDGLYTLVESTPNALFVDNVNEKSNKED